MRNLMYFLRRVICICIIPIQVQAAPPPALENLGPTCYMNAMLQCMHTLEKWYNDLLIPYYFGKKTKMNENEMLPRILTILEKMRKQEKLSQEDLRPAWQTVKKDIGDGQQDADDFFKTFMSKFDKFLQEEYEKESPETYKAAYKELQNLFTIQAQQYERIENIGPIAQEKSNREIQIMLKNIEESPNNKLSSYISYAIKDWKDPSAIPDEPITITQTPIYLVIILSLYRPDYTLFEEEITTPEYLTFTPTNTKETDSIPVLETGPPVMYQLCSTAIYQGSGTGGHYWAYVRDGKQWYTCDDSNIKKVPHFKTKWVPKNKYPYVLFYEKIEQPQEEAPIEIPGELWTSLYQHILFLAQAVSNTSSP